MSLKIFHLSVVLLNCFTIWYDQVYIDIALPEELMVLTRNLPLKYRYVFITYWCLILQTVYFSLALIIDFYDSSAQGPKISVIKRVKDAIFSVAFPCAFFIFFMFWGIYAYDKTLVFPDYVEQTFPAWVNHTIHTLIILFVLIELCFSPIKYPSKLIGITIGLGFAISYISVLVIAYLNTSSFIYPVLNAMTIWQVQAFVVFNLFFAICLYFVCFALHSIVNPSTRRQRYKKIK